jgi:hypothetical protein
VYWYECAANLVNYDVPGAVDEVYLEHRMRSQGSDSRTMYLLFLNFSRILQGQYFEAVRDFESHDKSLRIRHR